MFFYLYSKKDLNFQYFFEILQCIMFLIQSIIILMSTPLPHCLCSCGIVASIKKLGALCMNAIISNQSNSLQRRYKMKLQLKSVISRNIIAKILQ